MSSLLIPLMLFGLCRPAAAQVPADLASAYLAGRALPAGDPPGVAPAAAAALASAREVQAGCWETEDDAAYRIRATAVAERLGAGPRAAEAAKTYAACKRRVPGSASDPVLAEEVRRKVVEDAAARGLQAGARMNKLAQNFKPAGGEPGGVGEGAASQSQSGAASLAPGAGQTVSSGKRTPQEMAALIRDLNAAQNRDDRGVKLPAVAGRVPAPEFLSLGSAEVAPEPGVLDRASSLASSDSKTVAEDLANIQVTLKDADLPNVQGNTESNPGAIREFFVWLRTAKAADMPAIDYTILPKGEVGAYELGYLGKGDIRVNHFIRNEPARARASVVVHELYHYWDKKIARNYYPNVSYGKIANGTMHIHEYDAYLATSLYWQMVKREGDASPLARLLDRIPTDPAQVRELVDGVVK